MPLSISPNVCLLPSRHRSNGGSLFLSIAVLGLVVQLCLGFEALRHPNCTEACVGDTNPTCRTDVCTTVFDTKCPTGKLQKVHVEVDEQCQWTGCTPGGCENVGPKYKEVDKKICTDQETCKSHFLDVCYNEKCCPNESALTCCEALPCTIAYDNCQVPQQTFLDDPSQSVIENITVGHGASATFPFYNTTEVSPGSSCNAVRVYGRCLCDDGRNVPGCEPANSSSWYVRTDGPLSNTSSASAAGRLPANLSLTCAVLPPLPSSPAPAPPALPPPVAENGSAATAQGAVQPPASQAQPRDGHEGSRSHGTMVALIVVGCVVVAAVIVVTVLWCCGVLPDLHNLRIRSLTSYEPMFTGQSYTPGMGGHSLRSSRSSSTAAAGHIEPEEDIPWTRFCAAVAEGCRRILYGRRYVEESASAAAAAERYRTLNSLGRSSATGGGRGPPGKSRGSLVLSTLPSGRHKMYDDEFGVDEVFTLEDLGAGSSDMAGFPGGVRPMGHRAMRSPTGASGGPQLPQSLRASSNAATSPPAGPWRHGPGGAAPAELAGRGPSSVTAAAASTAPIPAMSGMPRSRLNQFGPGYEPPIEEAQGGLAGDGDGDGEVDGRISPDVIHTRPLELPGGGGGGGSGSDYDVPPDVDAPLHWLPTPQITGDPTSAGQQQQQQAPLLPPPPAPALRPLPPPPQKQQRGQSHHHDA